MDWRKLGRELELSRKDRIGILTLCILVVFSIYLPSMLTQAFQPPSQLPDSSWLAAIRELETREDEPFPEERPGNPRGSRQQGPGYSGRLNPFPFDPNTLSESGWIQLGIPEKTARTIQNYLAKGGKFRVKEDLKKIYGISPGQYEVLEDYIQITTHPYEYPKNDEKKIYTKHIPIPGSIDLNKSDTTAWIALPGIGSRLANRIVQFRKKLGGFHSMEQVREVYGLADSVFQKIKPYLKAEAGVVSKININAATLEELKAHPYIRYSLAAAIISYRNEHGPFSQLNDLKKIMIVTDEVFRKIEPYLSINEQ